MAGVSFCVSHSCLKTTEALNPDVYIKGTPYQEYSRAMMMDRDADTPSRYCTAVISGGLLTRYPWFL